MSILHLQNVKTNKEESEGDCHRVELLWDTKAEELIASWGAESKDTARKHNLAAKKFKYLYALFGLPLTVIPVVTGVVGDAIGPDMQTTLLLSTAVFAGITQFFNFGAKAQQHFEYQSRYTELANEIDVESIKPKQHRVACDMYMEHCLSIFNKLGSGAPDL
jgi:hypothetical protein